VQLGELEAAAPVLKPTKEREQKFGILLSPAQAGRDFEEWAREAEAVGNPIAILFVDVDEFKALNARLTEVKVDQTVLPDIQNLLAKLVQGRGEAYRQGGEEFVIVMPNLDPAEAAAFGEKVRGAFAQRTFATGSSEERVTVSVGVAVWPEHGATYEAVLAAANRAEAEAKKTRNVVRIAPAP
jgi:diguanylate cyclase (GGDEF)-like protein